MFVTSEVREWLAAGAQQSAGSDIYGLVLPGPAAATSSDAPAEEKSGTRPLVRRANSML